MRSCSDQVEGSVVQWADPSNLGSPNDCLQWIQDDQVYLYCICIGLRDCFWFLHLGPSASILKDSLRKDEV